jgi:hypothetical protein
MTVAEYQAQMMEQALAIFEGLTPEEQAEMLQPSLEQGEPAEQISNDARDSKLRSVSTHGSKRMLPMPKQWLQSPAIQS